MLLTDGDTASHIQDSYTESFVSSFNLLFLHLLNSTAPACPPTVVCWIPANPQAFELWCNVTHDAADPEKGSGKQTKSVVRDSAYKGKIMCL